MSRHGSSPVTSQSSDPDIGLLCVTNTPPPLPPRLAVDASQAGAGNLEIIVSVHGRNVPNYVQSEGNARFRVNFKPQESASHILSVRFNGEPVPGERGGRRGVLISRAGDSIPGGVIVW